MGGNTPTDSDRGVKAEEESGDARMADEKPTYRSWKKKYRKMRIVFDRKMHDGEDLHRHEQKALATARRLAIEKDQLLDLLLDVNNSLQIPPEKRFDLSLDPSSADRGGLHLDIDSREPKSDGATPAKSYTQLLAGIPHSKYATAAERFPELFADLEAGRDSPADPSQGQSHPPSFLTADDIDDYIWEIDNRTASDAAALLPTLAPAAQASGGTVNGKDTVITIASASRDFALRNPTSVYNWLRKHAPKTFLQDGEGHAAGDKENGDDHAVSARGNGRAAKGERGAGGGRASGAARGKRATAAHSRDKHAAGAENTEAVDDENGYDMETPSAVGGKGKRKRLVDEDPGYRPKGGSSRPAKKKRKSEGAEPTERASSTGPKKSRKSAGSVDTAMRDVED